MIYLVRPLKHVLIPHLTIEHYQVNLYLISQLEMTGLVAIFGYIGLAILLYMWQRRKRHDGVVCDHHTADPPERMLSLPVQK